ncbi:MAG: hypothetical protein IAE80_09155 [Anaerolinea sp.]|nr:hypothetical protein [Anaerolinea sp.]
MIRRLIYTLVHLIAAFAFVCGLVYVITAIVTPFTYVLPNVSAQQFTLVYTQAAYYGVVGVALFVFASALEISIRFATLNRRETEFAARNDRLLRVLAGNSQKTLMVMRQMGKLMSGRVAPAGRMPAPVAASVQFKSADALLDDEEN